MTDDARIAGEASRDHYTSLAMKRWGGSFVKTLGELAAHADPQNLRLIKHTWPDYWKTYEEMGRQIESEAT